MATSSPHPARLKSSSSPRRPVTGRLGSGGSRGSLRTLAVIGDPLHPVTPYHLTPNGSFPECPPDSSPA
ncbi:MAG: hypothetical protein MZV64_73685 [Ignavibacteriales bacterium]|nr:hypothetical protein [Ignavibacteriales bacterium]